MTTNPNDYGRLIIFHDCDAPRRVPMSDDELAAYAAKRRLVGMLAKAIIDGRLKILKGVSQIAEALGVSDGEARAALKEGRVQGAWRAGRR